jgi:hypothetical protein
MAIDQNRRGEQLFGDGPFALNRETTNKRRFFGPEQSRRSTLAR